MDAKIRAYFDAQANDPARRRRQEAKDLRTRYSLGFVDSDIYPRVMVCRLKTSCGFPRKERSAGRPKFVSRITGWRQWH